ncbi:S-layer homology domain-containing protein [Metasolibacillus meyeri]|uniref:S-layer homology domain-containing protein n=1 Tax=Metasolibacillus meyeri TaxID=1071052 RepID=A0AAW9NJ27_9BACL|nr:S-layer homology domain-containing protein [Metasolibacillus meyeri]MEC1177737.1 S-layer homology domain-containing protein [Metasolibacillus meyeri]
MANQPKKYKKFVATAATATLVASAIVPVASAANLSDISGNTHEEAINALVDAGVINGYPDGTFQPNKALTRSDVVKLLGKYLETEGYEPASDWKTRPAFADLKTTSNEELLKYASVVKEAGVFVGSHGNLLPGDLITRENMALTLVRLVNTLEGVSLEEFVAGQDFNGDVKDLNQAKAEARSAISVLDFYDITNPAVANFNPKGNTTRGQFATFLYKTANTDFSKVPTDESSEVVPEKVELLERSVQGNFGQNVTLKVKVTTKAGESAANIPVTFAINPGADELLQEQIKDEVLTDAEGVATYTYTRYDNKNQNFSDSVVAYASAETGKRTSGTVYWGSSLKIADVTEKAELPNGEQKVYKVTGAPNTTYFVTFKENLAVTPDKAVRGARVLGLVGYDGTESGNPATLNKVSVSNLYEYTTGGHVVGLITTDRNGVANLVVSGDDAKFTPVVYAGDTTKRVKYSATALQATASTVEFTAEAIYDLAIEAVGKQQAATRRDNQETGGRDYTVTLKGKDGKALANQNVRIGFSKATGTSEPSKIEVYKAGKALNDAPLTKSTTGDTTFVNVTTDKDGKATFTVTGLNNDYATPVAYIGTGALSTARVQKAAEIVYFHEVELHEYTSVLLAKDGDTETERVGQGQTAKFVYQLSDQNGKPRAYRVGQTVQPTEVTFTVRAGASAVTVTAGNVQKTIPAYGYEVVTHTVAGHSVEIDVVSAGVSDVTVTATATAQGLSGLPTVTKTIKFVSGAATPAFTVEANVVNGVTTTVDSVTLTFTEAVTTNEILVTNFAGGQTSTSATSDNKVLNVYFYGTKLTAAPNNTFSVSYKGKTYNFVYNTANGAITLASVN